jgi:hypothetical protein
MRWDEITDEDEDVLEMRIMQQNLRRRKVGRVLGYGTLILGGLTAAALAIGVALNSQHGITSRLGLGDVKISLDERCSSLNTAGIAGGETKFTDCVTPQGTHLLQEHSAFEVLEANYEFVPASKDTKGYQGGWGSRLGSSDQKLGIPSDCHKIINVGKSAGKKYIVCEAPDQTVYMREFSDWGIFEATYVFSRLADKDNYQGGWASRLGSKAQELKIPDQCDEIKSAGRTASTKYVDCELTNGDRMLQEFSDFGVLQATYILSKDAKKGLYQGGWVSRLGGKTQQLKLPEECTSVKNVGKSGSTKYVVCDTLKGSPILKEFSDLGLLEATYRFESN